MQKQVNIPRAPPAAAGRLALDGANHQALDEIALQEGVDHDDRHGGNHHRCHLHALRVVSTVVKGMHVVGHIRKGLVLDGAHQNPAQGGQTLIVGEVGRVVPGVPLVDSGIQRDGGQRRQGNRQHNAEEDPRRGCTVDVGRFLQLIGDVAEVGHQNRHPEEAEHLGHDVHPEGVEQAQVLQVQVGGNLAAVKEGGNDEWLP